MPNDNSPKRPTGRPRANIDWDIVDSHLVAGCCGTEIAGLLGVYPDTLYERCEEEKLTTFTAYSQQKKASGEALLRKKQFDKAMGFTETGDNTLLIWLGKARMGQKETSDVNLTPETIQVFDAIMNQFTKMQLARQNVPSKTDEGET